MEERLHTYPQHFEVAVLGCAVNGPGEAREADLGVAMGSGAPVSRAVAPVVYRTLSEIAECVELGADRIANPIDPNGLRN